MTRRTPAVASAGWRQRLGRRGTGDRRLGGRVLGRRGPGRQRLGRDPLWARLLIVVGVLLMLSSGTVLGATRVVANRYAEAVPTEQLLAAEARPPVQEAPRYNRIVGPLNYLLLGSDKREGYDEGERSDTIIILHIPATLDRAYLIAIPRDLRVQIPPYPPNGFRGGNDRINAAFHYAGGGAGGVQLLSATLTDMLGIRFNGAAVVDFGGFQQAVRQLGGVTMCVDVRTESVHVGFDKDGNFAKPYLGPNETNRNPLSTPMVYLPGCQHFNGWQALDYVRQRKSLPDGDYGRQRHQQQFVKALFTRALEKGVARNPIEADKFVRAIGQSFTIDTNGVRLADLVFGLRGIQPDSLIGIQVPSEPAMIGGASYIVPLADAETLYAALRDDTLEAWVLAHPTWVNAA